MIRTPSVTEDQEKVGMMIFKKLENVIVSEKLFLKPKLSREEVMRIAYIPKNKFAAIFTKNAGMNFTKYVNELRLEYACQVLKEHPEYTIEGVAKECGIPVVQTFYRLFFEKFGQTPTKYRKTLAD